jgi:hypothetical protein
VYTRSVNGEELTFGVSGKLYKSALVMFDRQTNSLWTQVDGSVLRGEMKGAQLQSVPVVQTTWREWKRMHPDTLVLKKERPIKDSPYAEYFADPTKIGMPGNTNPDQRLPGKEMVVTLRAGDDALAVPLTALKKKPLLETTLAGTPLAVVFNPAGNTARVFDRRLNGQTLEFVALRRGNRVVLRDRQTGTRWSGLTGKAVKGELAGQQLRPVPHMVNFWWAWVAYNPHTRLEP